MTTAVPWELRRRLTTWERLERDHASGRAHHDVLCSSPESCAAYGDVIDNQVDLLRRATALPVEDMEAIADSLAAPGLSSLRVLVDRAEHRRTVAT